MSEIVSLENKFLNYLNDNSLVNHIEKIYENLKLSNVENAIVQLSFKKLYMKIKKYI